jgi:hypothetical protein
MVASLVVAIHLLYWTQAGVNRILRARISSCMRRRNANGRGLVPVRANGRWLGADGTQLGADGWKWARTENDIARTGHNRRGRLWVGADGLQWARATL